MHNIITSKRFRLRARDFLKGAVMSVGTSVAVAVQKTIENGEVWFNWKSIGMVAVGSFIVYLIKNLLDKPKVIIPTTTNAQAEELKEKLQE
jgi:hypothetical protein